MRRFLSVVFGSALLFGFGAGPAFADNGPHVSTAVGAGVTGVNVVDTGGARCAGCHRAHTAKGSYLLKDDSAALCETCHAGAGAVTDVVNGKATTGGALRGGGFTNARLGASEATKDTGTVDTGHGFPSINQTIPALSVAEPTTSKHNVGQVGTMWSSGIVNSGPGTTTTLECGSCHDPHGNGNYRILKGMPTDGPATDVNGNPVGAVEIPDATQYVYTTTNYWNTGDVYTGMSTVNTKADNFTMNIAQWCSQCHTRDAAPRGSWSTPLTAADGTTVDQIYTYRHTSTHVDSMNGKNRNCITCHVAHGTNATMSGWAAQVALPDGSNGNSTTDSRLLRVDERGICVLCHNV